MKPSFLAFIIEYDEKLNQKGPKGILKSPWSLHIRSFWILPPITLSKRLKVR
jgi:hypothetical protein